MAGEGSYLLDPNNPTQGDLVRLLVGDTTAPFQLGDAEIAFVVAAWPNPYKAASVACTMLAAKASSLVTKTVGRMSINLSDRAKAYTAQAAQLLVLRRSTGSIGIMVGGQTWAQVADQRCNRSLVQPSFFKGDYDFYTTRDRTWGWNWGWGTDSWWAEGWPW